MGLVFTIKTICKIKLHRLLTFVFLAFCFYSCECVPGINTPREITPSQYAHVMFINSISGYDWDYVRMNTGYQNHVDDSYYNSSSYTYKEIIPALTNIYIQSPNNDSLIYNGLIDIQMAVPYTYIAYSANDRIQGMMLNDSIDSYSKTNAYFRCVHIGNDVPIVLFKIKDQYSIPITSSFRKSSQFNAVVQSNKYDIGVYDVNDSLLVGLNNQQFTAGVAYTIILRGYYKGTGKQKLNLFIVESDFWLNGQK